MFCNVTLRMAPKRKRISETCGGPLPRKYSKLRDAFSAVCAVSSVLLKTGAVCHTSNILPSASKLIGSPITLQHLQKMCYMLPSVLSIEPAQLSSTCEAGWSVGGVGDEKKSDEYMVVFKKLRRYLTKTKINKWSKELEKEMRKIVLVQHEHFLKTKCKTSWPSGGSLHPDFNIETISWPDVPMTPLPSHDDPLYIGSSASPEPNSSSIYTLRDTPLLSEKKRPTVDRFLEHLKSMSFYSDQMVHTRKIEAQRARYGTTRLSSEMVEVLKAYGYNRMYTHQASAIREIRSGRHVVISTSTSSGKSLVYNVCALASILRDPKATALYVFPTKALAQDQLGSLKKLLEVINKAAGSDITCTTLDGDSTFEARSLCQDRESYPNVILTNPDMLHFSILPRHEAFSPILERLTFIVLDEAHMYRGCFGSHVALVLRRLRRILDIHKTVYELRERGGNTVTTPTLSSRKNSGFGLRFIGCSATISNAGQHMEKLTGLKGFTVVDNDGSPSGEKTYIFWNPPLKSMSKDSKKSEKDSPAPRIGEFRPGMIGGVPLRGVPRGGVPVKRKRGGEWNRKAVERAARNKRLAMKKRYSRRSPHMETSLLLAELVRFGFKTITFCKVRKVCELILQRTHDMLRKSERARDVDWVPRIKSYRAGYRLDQRRRIERELFGGRLSGVVATSALELGIDVGSLDASLHLGFPGSVSSFFQQAGRCGRKSGDSLTIMVGYDSPLDQYVIRNPKETVFGKEFPHALIDPRNTHVLKKHVLCAAFEEPLDQKRDLYYFGCLTSTIREMASAGWLRRITSRTPTGDPTRLWVCNPAVGWESQLLQNHSSQHEKCSFNTAFHQPLPGSDPLTADIPADVIRANTSCDGDVGDEGFWAGEEGEADMQTNQTVWRGEEEGMARAQDRSPAADIALRNINEKEYRVILKQTGEEIDSVDEARAFFEVYPGACYLQQGVLYMVTYLDIHKLVAYVERCDLPYYTSQADHRGVTVTAILPIQARLRDNVLQRLNPIHISEETPEKSYEAKVEGDLKVMAKTLGDRERVEGEIHPQHGRVMVSTSVFAYHKIHRKTRVLIETVPLHLPDIQLSTKAFWVDIPPWIQVEVESKGYDFKGGIHGAAHTIAAITPLRLLCDSHADLATDCPNIKETVRRPNRLLVYERHKGGLGVSEMGCLLMPELLYLAAHAIRGCTCRDVLGCPQCVQSSSCPEYNEVMDKRAALMILDLMLKLVRI
ncbi:hypothetical protein AAMO2058_000829100 [Amorphochlora amoebiformis]